MGSSPLRVYLKIQDKTGLENVIANHLSCIGQEATPIEELPINDSFPDDQLLTISHEATLWYANLVKFKVCGVLPPRLSYRQRKKFIYATKHYVWEELVLYKLCKDGVYRRCLPEDASLAPFTITMP